MKPAEHETEIEQTDDDADDDQIDDRRDTSADDARRQGRVGVVMWVRLGDDLLFTCATEKPVDEAGHHVVGALTLSSDVGHDVLGHGRRRLPDDRLQVDAVDHLVGSPIKSMRSRTRLFRSISSSTSSTTWTATEAMIAFTGSMLWLDQQLTATGQVGSAAAERSPPGRVAAQHTTQVDCVD